MASQKEVAAWMYQELMRNGSLSQEHARSIILAQFDHKFTQGDRLALGLLQEFRRLTKRSAIWDGAKRAWRLQTDSLAS